jgi:hypothetical protein
MALDAAPITKVLNIFSITLVVTARDGDYQHEAGMVSDAI